MKESADANSTFVASGNAGPGPTAPLPSAGSKIAKARAVRAPKAKAQGAPTVSSLASSAAGRSRIEYLNPGAREVFIAGTFNEWDPRATALKSQGEGKWGIDLALAPGRYEYRLVVDGQWIEDPKSPGYSANPYGGLNSVLQIEPQR